MLTFRNIRFPKNAYNRGKEFLTLQLTFCERMSEITGTDLADTLAKYSEMLFLLRIGDTKNKVWGDFVGDLEKGREKLAIMIETINSRIHAPRYTRKNCVDEFAFDIVEGDNTKIQWYTLPFPSGSEPSIFNRERYREMVKKQKFLFTNVKEAFPQVKHVISYSWLYNLPSVCRLFPGGFINSRQKVYKGYRGLVAWGQFLNKNFFVKRSIAQQFLENVLKAKTKNELLEAFPYETYKCECNITEFFNFFDI